MDRFQIKDTGYSILIRSNTNLYEINKSDAELFNDGFSRCLLKDKNGGVYIDYRQISNVKLESQIELYGYLDLMIQNNTGGGSNTITLTTTGNSGSATLSPTGVLNIPSYNAVGIGAEPKITGSNGILVLNSNSVSTVTNNISDWDNAYSWGNHASYGYATTTYVNTAINNLVNGASPAMDTLYELSNSLNNDPSFGTNVVNQISTKWGNTGNTGTNASTHFIGTTDNVDFVMKTNSSTRFIIKDNGNILIGTTSDAGYKLDVNGNTILRGNNEITGYCRIGASGLQIRRSDDTGSGSSYGTLLFNTSDLLQSNRSIVTDTGIYGHGSFSTASVSINLGYSNTVFKMPGVSTGGFEFEFKTVQSAQQGLFKITNNTTSAFEIKSTNNICIGTSTDAGYKMDIYGSTRIISNSASAFQIGNAPGNYFLTINGATGVTTAQVFTSKNLTTRTDGNTGITTGSLLFYGNSVIQSINQFVKIYQTGGGLNGLIIDNDSALNASVYKILSCRLATTEVAYITGEGVGVLNKLRLLNLPTSSSGLTTGDLWNNAGVLQII